MTSLQLGLIVGGVVLVIGVLIYNWLQERRVRRTVAATFRKVEAGPAGARVEPTLAPAADDAADAPPATTAPVIPENLARDAVVADDPDFVPPLDYAPEEAAAPIVAGAAAPRPPPAAALTSAMLNSSAGDRAAQPDPDIECVVTLQLTRPVGVGALAAGLHARVGKPLRWFGRHDANAPWQVLRAESPGTWTELAACLLLADRAGAATRPLVERFIRLVADQAATLPAAYVAPNPDVEVVRAETLDRMCADLDVQIGLTVLKPGPATIQGTRLRGVAEAAGFRLAESGRFEWVQEDSGTVLYTLSNYRSEPFTAEGLRLSSTPGAVFLLDVPRVPDPVRAFDQMKLAAKRMTQTLDATLVDDNRHPLTDASFATIREQVQMTAAALKAMRVDPGSPRALALFGG